MSGAFTAAITGAIARRFPVRFSEKAFATYSDEAIVSLVRDGNTEAFGILVRRYEDFVYTLARGIVLSEDSAKDVAQETFLRAYRAIRRFEQRSSFKTWLYRIAYNTSMSHLKIQGSNEISISSLELEQPASSGTEYSIGKTLEKLIGFLKPDLKAVVILYYYEDLKYEEMAEVLDCPMGTVKIRLFRAKLELRKLWDRYAA